MLVMLTRCTWCGYNRSMLVMLTRCTRCGYSCSMLVILKPNMVQGATLFTALASKTEMSLAAGPVNGAWYDLSLIHI